MLNLKNVWLSKSHARLGIAITALTLVISGCGTENDLNTDSATGTVTLAKVTDIPQVSADNYDNNVNGLITGNTLSGWIDNWAANKPAGISGKLVILQATVGAAGYEYITPNGTDVFTYHATEWVQTRSNGVIMTPSMVPDGRSMDTFLAKYNIDPAKDMIVCAPGTAGASQVMQSGRCWYMFRYWGTSKEHLSHLNGGNNWIAANTTLDASYFSNTASTPPGTGSASVKDLAEANMVLQATLEDMMSITPTQDINLLNDGVFIWDARGSNEYDPQGNDANYRGGATQGHPNGTLDLNYNNLLNAAAGYTFKTKAEIQAYMTGADDGSGNAFLDGTLQPVGVSNAYQTGDVVYTYCQTTYRAMITGFASAAILGLPTRFYDGAMTEWNNLNIIANSSGNAPLPFDSPWRTDQATVSNFEYHSDPTNPAATQPVGTPSIVNAYASSANKVIEDDKAYKGLTVATSTSSTTTTTTGGSGGGVLPANPCGG